MCKFKYVMKFAHKTFALATWSLTTTAAAKNMLQQNVGYEGVQKEREREGKTERERERERAGGQRQQSGEAKATKWPPGTLRVCVLTVFYLLPS